MQIILNAFGTNTDVTPSLNVATVYTLVSATITTAAGTITQPQTGSAVVTVNTAPTINNPTPYVVCDDSLNNDGIYCFDLVIKNPEISTDPNVAIWTY